MGLESYITAIGQFKHDLINCMHYPEHYYINTKEGTTVITTLFHCYVSSDSRDLAKVLGVEIWDFNTHYINKKENINFSALSKINRLEAIIFKKLIDNNFMLIFEPNG